MLNQILITIISAVGAILTALITFAAERFIAWLNGKIKNDRAKGYLNTATDLVANVVKQTYQSYVQSIKGTDVWTKEAQSKALNNAIATSQHLMSTEVKDYISTTFGDITTWLTTEIESKIYDLKHTPLPDDILPAE